MQIAIHLLPSCRQILTIIRWFSVDYKFRDTFIVFIHCRRRRHMIRQTHWYCTYLRTPTGLQVYCRKIPFTNTYLCAHPRLWHTHSMMTMMMTCSCYVKYCLVLSVRFDEIRRFYWFNWYFDVRYGTVLYGIVLYCTVLYGTVLYGTVLYGIVL